MSKTQYYVAQSADGYIADAQGKLDWLFAFDKAAGVKEHYEAFLARVGAIAMGARTYEFLLEHMPDEWSYPGIPTWVFTHRALRTYEGQDVRFTTRDAGSVHAEMVTAAKGKNVWLVGGGNVVAQFASRGLLDELHLGVAPVILGGGAPVLPFAIKGALSLVSMKQFGMGFVELRYNLPRAL